MVIKIDSQLFSKTINCIFFHLQYKNISGFDDIVTKFVDVYALVLALGANLLEDLQFTWKISRRN